MEYEDVGSNEAKEDTQQKHTEEKRKKKKKDTFSVNIQLDVVQVGLFLAALFTRTWQLGSPKSVVFDELHFAKYVSLYMKQIFFFDVHPPLGKLILAFIGSYQGFEGHLGFERIGADYPSDFPLKSLRLIPALCGSLIVPMVYQIAVELGFTRWSALLAGAFLLLDNALLVQCRFILMEGMLLFFMCLSLLSYLKFRSLCHRSFSLQWFFWLSLTGVSFTCTLSVKYVGLFTAILVLYLIWRDYWKLLSDFTKSDLCLLYHMVARGVFLLVVPAVLYVYIFYIHLSVLTKAGPHDNIMTSAFQASLEGGLATLTKGQPLHIAYGSQITLKHTYDPAPGHPCWLHSHATPYPVKYKDGRGSSHQQQVTCYSYKDVNNWWIVKRPNQDSMLVDDPPEAVKNGDIIQLVHGITGRALNSHDVAAPVSPQHQEVSCYIDYNVSMPAQSLWKLDILNNGVYGGEKWETINSQVRLVHVNTSQAVKITGKFLPEWGFNQLEVATDRVVQQEATIWNVEEHRYTKSDNAQEEVGRHEMIPLNPTYLSFWQKFSELQYRMIMMGQDKDMEHKYSSSPLDWPFMKKNVAYWLSDNSNAQIHLVGNVVVWFTGTISIISYSGLLVFYLLRRRRECYDLTKDDWTHFLFVFDIVVVGYFIHYIPHFLTDKTLFLHHYLPCVIFKVLALSAVVNHIDMWLSQIRYGSKIMTNVIVILIAAALWVFQELLIVTYGNTNLNAEQVEKLTWMESWDFLLHK